MRTLKLSVSEAEHPEEKARIYLCAHPEDLPVWAEALKKDLFQVRRHCALLYPEEDDREWTEARRGELRRMHLFLMPVTFRLLTTRNRAMDLEYPLANTYHIPVLPVLMEEEARELFLKRFGKRAFLDRTGKCDAVLSYERNLDRFLDDVFMDYTREEEVRNAFDARIYLSCGTRNENDARGLIRLIHVKEAWRNVGVVYDRYRDSETDRPEIMQQAIASCDLFVLAVTDAFLNGKAPGSEKEYEWANRIGKKMLFVKTPSVKGNPKAEERFPDAADSADVYGFQKKLEALLGAQKNRSELPRAKAEYLTGLAYLYGLETETDHREALKHLEAAAGEGDLSALQKLSVLYRTGLGVQPDETEALRYETKRVEELFSRAASGAVREEVFLSELLGLGMHLAEAGEETAAERCEQYAWEALKDRKADLVTAERYGRLGDLSVVLGKRRDGRLSYAKQIRILSADRSPEALEVRLKGHLSLARLKEAAGEEAGARASFYAARKDAEAMLEATGSLWAKHLVGQISKSLGDLFLQAERAEEAEHAYQKGFRMDYKAVLEKDSYDRLLSLSESCARLGRLALFLKKRTEARVWYQKELELLERLLAESDAVPMRRRLARGFLRMGELEDSDGNPEGAREYDRKGYELLEVVKEEFVNPESLREAALAAEEIGNREFSAEHFDEAEEWYRKALSLRREGLRKYGEPEEYRAVARLDQKRGELEAETGDNEEACRWQEQGLYALLEVCEYTKGTGDRRALSRAASRLAELLLEDKKKSDARRWVELELDTAKNLAERTQSTEDFRLLADAFHHSAILLRAEGREQEGSEPEEKALRIRKQLYFETGRAEDALALRNSFYAFGTILRESGNPTQATELYESCLKISKAVYQESGDPNDLLLLADDCRELEDTAKEAGDFDRSRKWCKKGLELCLKQIQETGESEVLVRVALGCDRMGVLADLTANHREAQIWHKKAMEIRGKRYGK